MIVFCVLLIMFLFYIIYFIFFRNLNKNEVKSCENCICLKENNFCIYLKKTIKDTKELYCVKNKL
jgi:hypothetical protein